MSNKFYLTESSPDGILRCFKELSEVEYNAVITFLDSLRGGSNKKFNIKRECKEVIK